MRINIQRRKLLLSCVLGMASSLAQAGGYPDRPIRLVVGFPPGGGADYVARVVGQHLGETLGVSVVVENKPGANGTIAAGDVARMPADGYTLLLGVPASQSISPVLMPKLPYDPIRDFTAITNVGFTPLVLVVNSKTPAKSAGEFVKYVAASKDPVAYGSAGTGNITHMAGELFAQSTGLKKLRHIPYKGSSQVITDLIGGHVTAYFDTLPSSLPFIQSGQLRALGVTSGTRTSIAADIPTLKESGVTDYVVTTWFGILAPAKLNPEISEKIYQALRKGLDTADARKAFASRGIELVLDTPAQFQSTLAADIAQWREVTKKGNITAY